MANGKRKCEGKLVVFRSSHKVTSQSVKFRNVIRRYFLRQWPDSDHSRAKTK